MENLLIPSKYETFTEDRAVVVSVGLWPEWAGVSNRTVEWLRNWAWIRAGRPDDAIITVREE